MKSKNNPRASYSYLLKKIKFGIKNGKKNVYTFYSEWRNAEFSKKEHLFTKHSPEIEAAAKMIPKIFALKIQKYSLNVPKQLFVAMKMTRCEKDLKLPRT